MPNLVTNLLHDKIDLWVVLFLNIPAVGTFAENRPVQVMAIWEEVDVVRCGQERCVLNLLRGNPLVIKTRPLRLLQLEPSDREDPFAAVIRCTADPAKADKRTRSKWSRVMRYAAAYKLDSEPLGQLVKRKGGINSCVARFSLRLGRGTLHK